MEYTITFFIDNTQEQYTNCLKVIENIKKGQAHDYKAHEIIKKVKLLCSEKKLGFYDIVDNDFGDAVDSLPVLQDGYVTYLFYVNCSNESDIVNFIYYCLINDQLANRGMLCIKCNEKQRANVIDLFSELLSNKRIKDCYTYINGTYKILELKKNRKTKHFSPIFRIDELDETVEFWRQPMRSVLLQVYKKVRIKDSDSKIYYFTKNYFLPHICPSRLKKKYPNDVWKVRAKDKNISKIQHMLEVFVDCFCTGTISGRDVPINFVEDKYDNWKSEKLFDKIKDIPLLAMYIFCISDYFQRDITDSSWETIDQEIFNARDMADGILQILENIYHSESRSGYFCFRIHSNKLHRSKEYLYNTYMNYMKNWRNSGEEAQYFLEIKVVDFSHYTIRQQFKLDLKNRMQQADTGDKRIYDMLFSKIDNIKVSSFFDTSIFHDFWDAYNSISENVVHHYGLQIFESIVSCYNGFFEVRSQNTKKLCLETDFYSTCHTNPVMKETGLPGTQYDILIPFQKQDSMQKTSLDVNINYTDELNMKYTPCEGIGFAYPHCLKIFNDVYKKKDLTYQECKKQVIRVLLNELQDKLKNSSEDNIVHFSAKNISLSAIELFCKVLMLYIAQKPSYKNCYIMITDCTQSHFVEITRMMALFYNKQGQNPLMKNTQIFLSGIKEGEEFLITGSNLGEAIGSTEKLAFARCIHPHCLTILRKMLKNFPTGVTPNDIVKIAPFDMVCYNPEKGTLFEESVKTVLIEDIQSEKFGCKLENLHVRIGSKIHVRTFYEAELLFHNNYYTSRFSYWLFMDISTNRELDKTKPFVLVGYESYSEMLLNELCKMLGKSGLSTECLIYEEHITGKFRGKTSLEKYKDYQFVIIVPINSTLTTHIKISGFLKKKIQESMNKTKKNSTNTYELSKVINYGIILISHGKEYAENQRKMYWEPCDDKNTVISKISGEKMRFFIEISSKWENPLTCKACFPKDKLTHELPLVETNKESVVPMHAINIRKKTLPHEGYEDNSLKLEELSRLLIYKHVERNGNHFSYYFATEKMWDDREIRQNVRQWLKSKRDELFKPEECKVYDIIVAPLHYSNTVFVEEVNEYLFKNVALVLHFDADKEFRMNVKTKYSSVQQLYNNLCLDNEKSIINFHYVDDTIISGRTFHRMKSLISSLIKAEKKQVQVNIFKSIILVLNRMSKYSIKDYISDTKYYIAYFDLMISSMRVNSDACVLCKKYEERNRLAQQASLNTVYAYWKDKCDSIRCRPVEKITTINNRVSQERAAKYMLASHKAKKILDKICDTGDYEYIKHTIVEKLLPDEVSQSLEELIVVLKVLGRPFLTFRKEEKEAVFSIMLIMIDTLLADEKPVKNGKLYALLGQIWSKIDDRILIVKMLINRLAELESNYIIRKESINKILNFAKENINCEKEKEDFIYNYLNRIKQLVGQSNDFSKGLFLEFLLLYNLEYDDDLTCMQIVPLEGEEIENKFKKKIYLENTKLVDYGIEYLAEKFLQDSKATNADLVNVLNDNYYFDNFIQYLSFHQIVDSDQSGKVKKFVTLKEQNKIWGMVRFEMLYQSIFLDKSMNNDLKKINVREGELKDKFIEMVECLRDASGAYDGEIIVPYKNTKGNEKYIALELCKSDTLKAWENKEINIYNFMQQNTLFEDDTYLICKDLNQLRKKTKCILLKFYGTNYFENENISEIYLLFPFATENDGEILHSLKNILIFRYKIWRILSLSSGTLLKNWTDNLFYKQQMLKSRSVGHSELDQLIEKFDELSEYICQDKYSSIDDKEKNFLSDYFELIVNSMIGAMNAKVLGNRGTDYREKMERKFTEFWDAEKNMKEVILVVWNLEINLKNYSHLSRYMIRFGTRKDLSKVGPNYMALKILFLTIFHNAWKHGKYDERGICKVFVYEQDEKLCISNCIDENEKGRIEKEIAPEAYRSGQGISQAVVFDFCKSWYDDALFENMFNLEWNKKIDDKELYYVVKLPIIERR